MKFLLFPDIESNLSTMVESTVLFKGNPLRMFELFAASNPDSPVVD
jgi:hypothetical protein